MTSPPAARTSGSMAGGAVREVDHRRAVPADGLEHPARPGRREALVVARAEGADPRVEELQDLGAGRELGEQVGDHGVGEQVHEPREGRRLAVHELLDLDVVRANGRPRSRSWPA